MLIICFEEKQTTIIIESSRFRSRHEKATELALIFRLMSLKNQYLHVRGV